MQLSSGRRFVARASVFAPRPSGGNSPSVALASRSSSLWSQKAGRRGDSDKQSTLGPTPLKSVLVAGVGIFAASNMPAQRTGSMTFCSASATEVDLGSARDFEEGELYEIKVHDGKGVVLLTKLEGKFYCSGNSCSHYSAQLHKGCQNKGVVACPWHNAQFDMKTGKPVDGPGLEPIPVYPVTLRNGNVFASLPQELQEKAAAKMSKYDPSDKRSFVIVGGGAGATSAAITLREDGYTGKISIYTEEETLPYDRPVMSKGLKAPVSRVWLKSPEFWKEADVNIITGAKVIKFDAKLRQMTTSKGEVVKYDKALIASGSTPRKLKIPGSDLKNIFTLRGLEDRDKIAPFAHRDMRVVVIGSSWIGMEVAASLAKSGAVVTIVGKEKVPFERILGERIGSKIRAYYNQKGIRFEGGANVRQFRGRTTHPHEDEVQGVILDSGEILQADAVIIGVGVSPNGEVVPGIQKAADGSIVCDAFMRTSDESIYAAGDVASFPYFKTGELTRIEHWNVAMQHGRIAARNMLGKHDVFSQTPFFFWSMLFGKSLRYCGHCTDYDDVVIEGDLDALEFVAYYSKNGLVQAVATMGKDPFAAVAAQVLSLNLMPTTAELRIGAANSESITTKLKEYNTRKLPVPKEAP